MKELPAHCSRTDLKKTISKLEASQQQLDGSIAFFFKGDWVCAITLAGAAEYMLPVVDENADLLARLKAHFAPSGDASDESKFVSYVNDQRDWLKHSQPNKPQQMEFSQDDAINLIMRAYSRLFASTNTQSENMLEFANWLIQTHPELSDNSFQQGS